MTNDPTRLRASHVNLCEPCDESMNAHSPFTGMILEQRLAIPLLAVGLCIVVLVTNVGCSFNGCSRLVASEAEAKQALASFFRSNSSSAGKLIAGLRKDGLTDQYLAKLQGGCAHCYAFRGHGHDYDPERWYVATSIAPPMDKKDVVLEVNCATDVRLDHTLYGG